MMRDNYRVISSIYNYCSWLYSFGAISACRDAAVAHLREGESICFLGVGEGAEAIEALRVGAKVTVVDSSKAMLSQFESRMDDEGYSMEQVNVHHEDALGFLKHHMARYDVVVANFFLNVFDEHEMNQILDKMVDVCAEKGNIVIGDFWYDARANVFVQSLQKLNWWLALLIFRVLVRNAKHSIYVYDELLVARGCSVQHQQVFKVFGVGMYRSVRASCGAREDYD